MKTNLISEWWGSRHAFTLMSFLGLSNLYAMRVNLSVAIVAMTSSGDHFLQVMLTLLLKRLNDFCSSSFTILVTNRIKVEYKDAQ